MKRLKQFTLACAVLLGVATVALPAGTAHAINVFQPCASNQASDVCKAQSKDNANHMIKDVINTLLYALGVVAIIMIIVGGLRYVLSAGDASKIQSAKNTIMYSVVGLVIAILAYSIVNYIIFAFK